MKTDISRFMAHALAMATKAQELEEVPVGAVVVFKGEVIAAEHNLSESQKDATLHAEILAMRQACKVLDSKFLLNCDLYVTLEPCPMCAYATSLMRIERLYFGAYDPKSGGIFSNLSILHSAAAHHKPLIYPEICASKSEALLKSFFRARRN